MDTPRMPEQVEKLVARIRRTTRGWIWIESLAIIAVAACFGITATLAIDWLIEPPAWARAALVVAVSAGLLWLVATKLVMRLGTPLSDRSLALVVERCHPEFGDTLSTAVGFAGHEVRDIDPGLVQRTMEAATSLVRQVDARRLFRRRRLAGLAALGIVTTGAVAGLAATWPDVAAMWTRRMVLLHDTPWPRRVRFEAIGFHGQAITVARGSDVEVLVRATTTSGSIPDLVELRIRGGNGTNIRTARMGTRGGTAADGQLFAHTIEAVGEDLELDVGGGDGRLRGLQVHVVEPPTLAGVAIVYELPAYLGGGERSPPFSRVVPVPRGSHVAVTFTTSKKFSTARLTARFATEHGSDIPPETTLTEVTSTDPPTNTIAAMISSLDADGTLALTLTDTDGIAPREPFLVSLAAVPDEPPTVSLRLSDISGAVTSKARLRVIGTLADDYGLADAAIQIHRGNDTSQLSIARIRGGETLVDIVRDAPEIVPLEPLGLRPGDRLAVNAIARDTCGLSATPNKTVGDTWTLEVVTPEALQAALEAREILLRRRFEAAIDDLVLARRGLDETPPASTQTFTQAAGRLGEAAARCVGEAGEIAAAFRSIRNEFDANGLLTAELETRLVDQVATPLAALAENGLNGLASACRAATAGALEKPALEAQADTAINALKAILARLLELESFNEVVEKLRAIIRTQEQIRTDTLEQQRKRARQALEGL
jgi:hypothetical protein